MSNYSPRSYHIQSMNNKYHIRTTKTSHLPWGAIFCLYLIYSCIKGQKVIKNGSRMISEKKREFMAVIKKQQTEGVMNQ